MEAELKQWGARLDKLMAKADASGTEAKIDYRKRLDDLSEKYVAAEKRLTELKAAGSTSGTPQGGVETPGASSRRRSRSWRTSAGRRRMSWRICLFAER